VVEIGPGLGALTFPLARTGARVVAVEVDRTLAGLLRERLGRKLRQRVEVVVKDALSFDFTAHGQGLVVVGNLPFHISSPLIFKLLDLGPAVDRAVLTLQKEVADRILSPPGPKIYGIISIMVQLKAQVEPVLSLPQGAFFPQPKVAAQTIRFQFNQAPPLALADEALFNKLVRAAFGQRRKTLRQALLKAPLGLDLDRLERAFSQAGLDPGLRAEKLSVADFIALTNALKSDRLS